MIIGLYLLIVSLVIPTLGAYANALSEPVMIIVIILAGIMILFGSIGMKISNNLGSTIAGNIFKAIGYVFKKMIDAIGWIVKKVVNLIPVVFKKSRTIFRKKCNELVSNVLATLTTILIVAIII